MNDRPVEDIAFRVGITYPFQRVAKKHAELLAVYERPKSDIRRTPIDYSVTKLITIKDVSKQAKRYSCWLFSFLVEGPQRVSVLQEFAKNSVDQRNYPLMTTVWDHLKPRLDAEEPEMVYSLRQSTEVSTSQKKTLKEKVKKIFR